MSDFVRYQHVERIGLCGNELDGLLEGEVFVFPKIDGANHCVYFDKDLGRVGIASRNQLLSMGYDTTKFWHFAVAHKGLENVVTEHPNWRIYGDNENIVYEDKPVIERFPEPLNEKVTFHYKFPEIVLQDSSC